MARLFSKKQTKEKFGFVGNRQHIRTVGEMLTVNKEEADLAFKRYKKEIIDDLLLGNGFYKYKSNAYVRLNNTCWIFGASVTGVARCESCTIESGWC